MILASLPYFFFPLFRGFIFFITELLRSTSIQPKKFVFLHDLIVATLTVAYIAAAVAFTLYFLQYFDAANLEKSLRFNVFFEFVLVGIGFAGPFVKIRSDKK